MNVRDRGFRTQAEAVKEARQFFWGDQSWAKREYVKPAEFVDRFQAASLVVAANVNGNLVVFEFDGWGRLGPRQPSGTDKMLVIKKGA